MRLVVVLAVASAITLAATALGLDGEWMVVSVGEALLALTLLSRI